MREIIDVTLFSGGVVHLTVKTDFLTMTLADAGFVIDLAGRMRAYKKTIEPLPKPAEQQPPKPVVKHRAKRNGVAKVDWSEIAKVYITAVAADGKPIDAMCRAFNAERTVVKNWPGKLRQLGLIPPRGEPVIHTEAPFIGRRP